VRRLNQPFNQPYIRLQDVYPCLREDLVVKSMNFHASRGPRLISRATRDQPLVLHPSAYNTAFLTASFVEQKATGIKSTGPVKQDS